MITVDCGEDFHLDCEGIGLGGFTCTCTCHRSLNLVDLSGALGAVAQGHLDIAHDACGTPYPEDLDPEQAYHRAAFDALSDVSLAISTIWADEAERDLTGWAEEIPYDWELGEDAYPMYDNGLYHATLADCYGLDG